MSTDSWRGSWTQKWVQQVASGRFRNFVVPRTSLLSRLRSFSETHGDNSRAKGGKPVVTEEKQVYVPSAYSLPLTTYRAVNFKPRSLDPSGYHYTQYPMDTSSATSIPETNESDTSRTSSQSEGRGGHVFKVVLGIFGLLAVLAVVGVAVYFKLATDDYQISRARRCAVNLSMKLTDQEFSEQLRNKSSEEFADFEYSFCSNMTVIFASELTLGSYRGCSVVDLRNGSIVVDVILYFISNSAPTVTNILTSLVKGSNFTEGTITLATGIEIDESSVQVLNISDSVLIADFVPNIPVSVPPGQTARPAVTTTATTPSPEDNTNTTAAFNITTELFNTANETTESGPDANSTLTDGSNSTTTPDGFTADPLNSTELSTDGSNSTESISTPPSLENENSTAFDGVNYTIPGLNEGFNFTSNSTTDSNFDNGNTSDPLPPLDGLNSTENETAEAEDGYNSTNTSTAAYTDGLSNATFSAASNVPSTTSSTNETWTLNTSSGDNQTMTSGINSSQSSTAATILSSTTPTTRARPTSTASTTTT